MITKFINQNKLNKYTLLLIIISFCLSLIISKSNLIKYDKINEFEGKSYHQMIKSDPLRYMAHGNEIKENIIQGKNFFKTGRENYTKYLPPRLVALYLLIINENLFDSSTSQIKTGIYFPYLFFQCLFYYLSILFLYLIIKRKFNEKISFLIILFLSLEPTVFQYHGTFWSESVFFSLQIFILAQLLKDNKKLNTFIYIGVLIGLLSLQKQYAIFLFFPIIIFFLIFEKQKKIKKTIFLFVGFLIIQILLGTNNYIRSGNFYVITADMKHGAHMDLISKVMTKKMKISKKDFYIIEGEAAKKWAESQNISTNEYNENKLDIYEFRMKIVNEADKVKLDNFLANRSIDYLINNFFDFFKFILKQSIHTVLLNPFHIYSDHNFASGELYYETDTHDKLVPVRIFYTFIIYTICLFGFYELYKKKKYKEISLFLIFFLYFYLFVSWHGNTRYFVPCVIYLSIFFSFGFMKILSFLKIKYIR